MDFLNMIQKRSNKYKPKNPTGPAPERVKTDRPWEEAVKDVLDKERPKDGWPKREKK